MGVTRYVATYRNKEKIAAQMDALPIVLHGSKTIFISASDVSAIQGQSNVIDFGTNRKRICDFLLVRHVTLVLSCTVSEILQVFCASDPPLFHPILGVPVAPDRRGWVNQSRYLKLFSRKIIFEVFQRV